MRITRLFILLLSFKRPIQSSAQLVERQPQGVWPDWNLGDLLWDSVTGFRGIGGLFQDPQNSDSSKTKPSPDADTESDGQSPPDSPNVEPASPPPSTTPSPAEPVYKLGINNDPSPIPDLVPNLPAGLPSNEGCDLLNMNDAGCGQTTDQLIFTSSCAGINPNRVVSDEAKAQNQAIRETLDVMNGQNILAGRGGRGLRISTSDICDVYFFAVPLTKSQAQDIQKKPGVRTVRPNQDLRMDDTPGNSDLEDGNPAEIPVLTKPGSQLKQRDQIVVDTLAWEDLRFVSTPPNQELSRAYFYHSNAGQGVTIFALDRGVNTLSDEFVTMTGENSLLEERIFAMDTSGLPDDEDSLGTCRTSKMVGRTYGVARRAKVMITKVSPMLSSLLDVFVQIANYLNAKNLNEERVIGYHILSIVIQWDDEDQEITALFEEILNLLISHFQLVVVVQAGMDLTEKNSDINKWPATAERRHDIIVVGAVEPKTGRTSSFSRGGPFLTVNAPGTVNCARNQAGRSHMRRRGTDVAAAQVAGLAAYFLSLDDVGPILRENRLMIPFKVKVFLMTVASYKRSDDGFLAIWNLLGPSS